MIESRSENLARCRCGDSQAMEIPLADCGSGGSALDTSAYGQGPEVDKDEEDAKPPGSGVNDEEVFGIGEMAAEEDAGKHCHPDPCPCDDTKEGCEAEEEKARIGGEDAAGKLEDGDCFAKGVSAFVDGEGPEDGEDSGNEREPAHSFILDGVATRLAFETEYERVEEEGE